MRRWSESLFRVPLPDSARLRRTLLAVVLLAGSFQAGRLAERAVWPCRLRPLAPLVGPLLGRELPSEELCELLERIPRL